MDSWLVSAMTNYNHASLEKKEAYVASIHMPGKILAELVSWCFQSLPDEILVGIDVDNNKPHNSDVEELFRGHDHRDMYK